MMTLFNQEYALKVYGEEKWREGRQEGRQEGRREGKQEGQQEMAVNLADMGFSNEQIAQAAKVSVQLVRQWLKGAPALTKSATNNR